MARSEQCRLETQRDGEGVRLLPFGGYELGRVPVVEEEIASAERAPDSLLSQRFGRLRDYSGDAQPPPRRSTAKKFTTRSTRGRGNMIRWG